MVIGIVLLIGGFVLLGMSMIRETKFVTRSINDDELRAYLEAGEYQLHASYFVPENYPPKIKIYDSYDNLIYEKDYASKSDFTVPAAGVYRIHVTNVQEDNGILEVGRILYRFKNLFLLGVSLVALGIALTVVGVIKPYKKHRSGEAK